METKFNTKIINDTIILVSDKKVFKDDEEHIYIFDCYDGVAFGRISSDEKKSRFSTLIMSYPTVAELRKNPKKVDAIREYVGLDDDDEINYHDIALKYGKLGKYGYNADELNLIEKIARANKVDTWLDVTREGNFRDREEGKEISAKKAMQGFIDALQYEDFVALTDEEKFTLLGVVAKVL